MAGLAANVKLSLFNSVRLRTCALTVQGRIPLYSSQLQTWSKTWTQSGRKHVESQLRTCLKRVFFTFHLSSTHTNQRTCCGSRPGFRQQKSTACRKRVESMSQTRTNLSKTWLQTWSKTRFAARFAAG